MEPIRVIHVVGTMDLGGAETFLMNVYRNIERDKVQFDFLCHNRTDAKYTDEILKLGGKVYCVQGMSHIGFIGYQKQLKRFFEDHSDYKIVHSHQSTLNGIILKQAGDAFRISHCHVALPANSLKSKLLTIFFKTYINKKNISHAFACSQKAADYLYRGSLHKAARIIHNAIDTGKFCFNEKTRKKIREEFELDNCFVIGHVGRFMEQKNHRFLIEIFEEFAANNDLTRLMLVGVGKLQDEIRSLVKARGIESKVLFLNSRTDIQDLMCAMDMFLLPSLYEGLPVVGVEAQSAGLPILASDTVSSELGFTDLVHFMPLQASKAQWAKKVDEISKDINIEKRYSYNNLVKLQGYDINEISEMLQELYLSLYKNK